MKTPQELKSIFDKFPKEKIELKREKVELSIIDDIEKSIAKGLSLKDNAYKAIDKAKIEILKASDIARFDMADFYVKADKLINEAEEKLKAIGMDGKYINDLKVKLEGLDSVMGKIIQKVDKTSLI